MFADSHDGDRQLLVYHFMFGPGYRAGCPSCSAIADGFDGFVVHLAGHDVTLCAVSRAPLEKIQAYQARMGWSFPWASSSGSDFSYDLQAASTPQQQQAGTGEYNFRPVDMRPALAAGQQGPLAEWAATCGTDFATYARERPGMSTFAVEDGVVYHTYSAYARGLDGLWGTARTKRDACPRRPPQLVPPPRRVRQRVMADSGRHLAPSIVLQLESKE